MATKECCAFRAVMPSCALVLVLSGCSETSGDLNGPVGPPLESLRGASNREVAAFESAFEIASLRTMLHGVLETQATHDIHGGSMPQFGDQRRLDVSAGWSVEPTIAAQGDRLIAGWIGKAPDFEAHSFFATSDDGGESWDRFLLAGANPTRLEGDPSIAVDPQSGEAWLGTLSLRAELSPGFFGQVVSVARMASTGPLEPVAVFAGVQLDKPWLAAGPDPLNPASTVVYMVHSLGLQRSQDLGLTWTDPLRLDPERELGVFGEGLGHQSVIDPQGNLFVAFWDLEDGIFLVRSTDGGRTVDAPRRIVQRLDFWDPNDGSRFPGAFRVPPFFSLAQDTGDGTLYLVYFDTGALPAGEADVDLFLTRSEDGGETWTEPQALDTGDTAGDQFMPSATVDSSGRVHLVFFDTRHTPQADGSSEGWLDVYYAFSLDRGDSWQEARLTSESFRSSVSWDPGDLQFIGDYLGIASQGDTVFAVFPSTQNGDSDIFVRSIDFGAGEPPDQTRCQADVLTLCLGERFAVRAHWSTSSGEGEGRARALTSDTGAFWFFTDANIEAIVKVVDGCRLNEHFWVFASGLTNVEVELTVTDTRTGEERAYFNPPSTPFRPIQDTSAFATCDR